MWDQQLQDVGGSWWHPLQWHRVSGAGSPRSAMLLRVPTRELPRPGASHPALPPALGDSRGRRVLGRDAALPAHAVGAGAESPPAVPTAPPWPPDPLDAGPLSAPCGAQVRGEVFPSSQQQDRSGAFCPQAEACGKGAPKGLPPPAVAAPAPR